MAKNYKNSDYALNKYSAGIVYRFADRIIEVTLADYLAENPDKAVQDFLELKTLSDEIYHQQVVDENRTSRLDVTLNDWADSEQLATQALEDEIVEREEEQRAVSAFQSLWNSGLLTEIQKHRLFLYLSAGLSTRQIAAKEGVTQRAVMKSIHAAINKLKINF